VRKVLVTAQIALATLLLFGAGLFARSLSNLMQVDPGFRTEKVMTFVVSPRQAGYDLQRGTQFYSDLVGRIRQLPGVTAVAGAAPGPLTGSNRGSNLTVQGYTPPPNEEAGSGVHSVTPGWFSALGIRFLAGRDFTEADRAGGPKVAIVNDAFAKKYCEGNAVGRRMKWGSGKGDLDIEIVGQFADIRHSDLREPVKPAVYMPYTQEQQLQRMTFYVRSANDPQSMPGVLRDAVRSLDRDLPVYQLKPLQEEITEAVSADRTMAILCTAFSVLAILLTAIGIYGVIAWTVARRTNEIAVRMALGALPERVLRLVMREVVVLTSAGIAAGVALALISARVVESKLFGVTGRDPLMLAIAIVCTALMAAVASFVPAWRATRIDPSRALRFE
jgi:predicted permease